MNQDIPINQLLFSTLRIQAQLPSELSIGTGFIIAYESDGKRYLFLVTNKHIVQHATEGKFFFTKSDGTVPVIGQRHDVMISNFEEAWFYHPDDDIDIAIMPLVPLLKKIKEQAQRVYYRSIPLSLVPTKEQEESLTALEEIIFIGYPSGIYDTKNLLPVIRKGTTATPISIDYEGKPLFLIDASVFRGSSGSPVLIYNQGSYATPQGISLGTRIHFIGILSKLLYREEKGSIEFTEIPTTLTPVVRTEQMLNLGVVVKSREINKAVEAFLRRRGVF